MSLLHAVVHGGGTPEYVNSVYNNSINTVVTKTCAKVFQNGDLLIVVGGEDILRVRGDGTHVWRYKINSTVISTTLDGSDNIYIASLISNNGYGVVLSKFDSSFNLVASYQKWVNGFEYIIDGLFFDKNDNYLYTLIRVENQTWLQKFNTSLSQIYCMTISPSQVDSIYYQSSISYVDSLYVHIVFQQSPYDVYLASINKTTGAGFTNNAFLVSSGDGEVTTAAYNITNGYNYCLSNEENTTIQIHKYRGGGAITSKKITVAGYNITANQNAIVCNSLGDVFVCLQLTNKKSFILLQISSNLATLKKAILITSTSITFSNQSPASDNMMLVDSLDNIIIGVPADPFNRQFNLILDSTLSKALNLSSVGLTSSNASGIVALSAQTSPSVATLSAVNGTNTLTTFSTVISASTASVTKQQIT